jgi:hypothetical protein
VTPIIDPEPVSSSKKEEGSIPALEVPQTPEKVDDSLNTLFSDADVQDALPPPPEPPKDIALEIGQGPQTLVDTSGVANSSSATDISFDIGGDISFDIGGDISPAGMELSSLGSSGTSGGEIPATIVPMDTSTPSTLSSVTDTLPSTELSTTSILATSTLPTVSTSENPPADPVVTLDVSSPLFSLLNDQEGVVPVGGSEGTEIAIVESSGAPATEIVASSSSILDMVESPKNPPSLGASLVTDVVIPASQSSGENVSILGGGESAVKPEENL